MVTWIPTRPVLVVGLMMENASPRTTVPPVKMLVLRSRLREADGVYAFALRLRRLRKSRLIITMMSDQRMNTPEKISDLGNASKQVRLKTRRPAGDKS